MLSEQQSRSVLDAKRTMVAAAVEIWNVRLELLRDHGDLRALITHLKTAAEADDTNLGCNGNCHCGAPGPDVSQPARSHLG